MLNQALAEAGVPTSGQGGAGNSRMMFDIDGEDI